MRLKLFRGRYYAVWHGPGGTQRRALRTADRAAAEAALAALAAARAKPARSTVSQIAAAYLADKDQTAARPSRLREAWKALAPQFAELGPDQVDRTACRSYARRRGAAGVQPGTIRKELSVLRAALRWHDPHTPAIVELPASPPPRDRHLTRAEYDRLRQAARRTPHLHLFCVLGLATAGRSGAILDLTWDRVDLARGLVRLGERKGQKGRATVPLTEAATAALHEARQAATSPYVVEYGGARIASIKHAFRRAATRAGLSDVTPHVLRHTAAVWMAEAGIPMPEIAQYLGHSDSRITERVYARYGATYLRKAASALEVGKERGPVGAIAPGKADVRGKFRRSLGETKR